MSLLQADCLEVSRFNRFPDEVVQFSSCPHFPSHNSGHQSSPKLMIMYILYPAFLSYSNVVLLDRL